MRTAIATALDTVSGLRVESDGVWPEAVNPPAALVRPADAGAAPLVLDGSAWSEPVEVTVVVSLAPGLKRAQAALDTYYDGVRSALLANLGGTLLSVSRQAHGVLEIDTVEYLGFVLRLEMIDQ